MCTPVITTIVVSFGPLLAGLYFLYLSNSISCFRVPLLPTVSYWFLGVEGAQPLRIGKPYNFYDSFKKMGAQSLSLHVNSIDSELDQVLRNERAATADSMPINEAFIVVQFAQSCCDEDSGKIIRTYCVNKPARST